MSYIPAVRAFHEAMRIDAPPKPGLPGSLGPQCRLLRLHLITEEYSELAGALAGRDMVKCLDGLADLEVVTCGTLVACGADRSPQAAMIPDYSLGSAGPPNFPHPDLFLQVSSDFLATASDLSQRLADGDWQAIAGAALLLRARLSSLWACFRVPEALRQAVFDEVMRSNMTKLDANGNPVISAGGRVVKGPLYDPPQIARVLAEHTSPAAREHAQ